jgi:hypothetical protein
MDPLSFDKSNISKTVKSNINSLNQPMLKYIQEYVNTQGIQPSPVEPFAPDDFVLVMNEAISRFSKEQKKPENNYTFFIDYLLNAISKHNKGSVTLINTRISKFLCTFVKHSKDNHEVLLLTKFLTPTFYGTADCVKFYLEVRKLVFQIFNDQSTRTQKLRGLDVEITRAQVLCSAMKISFTKTCQILGIDPKKYRKNIPVVNLILVMLELNFNNNKDSFELKKKKLQ